MYNKKLEIKIDKYMNIQNIYIDIPQIVLTNKNNLNY